MRRIATLVCVLAVTSHILLADAGRAEERITPKRLWEGDFPDEKLKQEAPKGGVITDAKAFAKLWKAWRPSEAVSKVDFEKEFAFIAMCVTKGERPAPIPTIDGDVLWVNWDAARRGGGGWGYAILIFDRKGVKKVNGVTLEPGKPKDEGPKK